MDIRKAEDTENDCNLVFALSNDPKVRASSFATEKIEYSCHLRWYEKAIKDSNLLFYMVFENNAFVGQIRFKRESAQVEDCIVSLSITKPFRGKGVALTFLMKGIQKMKEDWRRIKYIVAEVKPENAASNKLFESSGFRRVETGTIYIYKLEIK